MIITSFIFEIFEILSVSLFHLDSILCFHEICLIFFKLELINENGLNEKGNFIDVS